MQVVLTYCFGARISLNLRYESAADPHHANFHHNRHSHDGGNVDIFMPFRPARTSGYGPLRATDGDVSRFLARHSRLPRSG